MAKEVHGRRDDEDDRKQSANQQTQGQRNNPQQQDEYNQRMQDEQVKQSEQAAKERQTYLDEMNRRIEEVVNFAGQHKDKNPQMLNLTSEALKNAADQIDAATPQGVARNTAPSSNPQPSMR